MVTTTVPAISPRLDSYPDESSLREEYLPESDGRPMSETDLHRKLMIALLHALEEYYRDHPQVYVSGNIFIYYRDEAGALQPVSPDIFVVFGVAKKDRRIYKLEDEGQAPQVVIELTSTSTKVEDFVAKHYIYARMGVREYFLFDPYSETSHTTLRGFRLEGGEYTPMHRDSLHSEVLGLELRVEDGLLRLYDPKTGEYLRTPEETEIALRLEKAARQIAEDKAEDELAARQAAEAKAAAAEAELARLREELAKLRGTNA
jgi:Uma2 family endonuclease